ncbi:MAG: pyruvate kinase [Chitinispirillia bacterium]|nr:pyruvate kinase [Chitinispirillia bacterium]
MKKYILTVGPSLLKKVPISKVHKPSYIYRINGAHGTGESIREMIGEIRSQVGGAEILMDLPGNKVRTKDIGGISIEKGKTFEIPSRCFNYGGFYKLLKPGMTAWANDSTFEFVVEAANSEKITFLSKSNGVLIDNKGVHIRNIHDGLPFLFEKDMELIGIANECALNYVGLSFVRKADDIRLAKTHVKSGIELISKVETIEAVNNLNEILGEVEHILVDRGDLSTDVGIENIPCYQNFIIEKALYFNKKIFIATQVLKHMEDRPIPTIAEIDDLYNISKKGVYGIQLSEETAVGGYVEECLSVLEKVSACIAGEVMGGTFSC